MESYHCPLCGQLSANPSPEVPHVGASDSGSADFGVASCPGCGLVHTSPWPTPERVNGAYDASYYGSARKFGPKIHHLRAFLAGRHARRLCRALPPGAHALDVGCGDGILLAALASRGVICMGVERVDLGWASPDPSQTLRYHVGPLDDLNREQAGRFHLAVLWHVLEHLPNPDRTLRTLRRLIHPEGRLIVAVPNYQSIQARLFGSRWFHLDLPRHMYHFGPGTLTALLRRTGWDVSSVKGWDVEQNIYGWVQGFLDGLGFPRGGLYDYLRAQGADPAVPGRAARWGMFATLPVLLPAAAIAAIAEWAVGRPGTLYVSSRPSRAQGEEGAPPEPRVETI